MERLSHNEKEMLASLALLKMVGEKKLTDREALIYTVMRRQAFPNKNGTRNRCRRSAVTFSELLQVNRNKVVYKLKSLEAKELIRPIYRVKIGKEIREFSNYDDAKKFGIKNIRTTHYIIFDLPNEKKEIKKYIKKKLKL